MANVFFAKLALMTEYVVFSFGLWGVGEALSPHAVVPRSLIALCCFVCVGMFLVLGGGMLLPLGALGAVPPHAVTPQLEPFGFVSVAILAQLAERLDF